MYFTDRHINGANLNAINEAGELTWVNHVTNNTRQHIRIFVNQQGRDFANTSLGGFRPIDPQTGHLGEPIHLPDNMLGRYIFYEGYFWNVYSGRLEAYPVENATEIDWASNYQNLLWYMHQIWANDDVIILRLNDTIQALTRTEGDFLWGYDDTEVVSNVNIVDGHVYALDMNADLLKFDIETGEIAGRVVFAPPEEDARDTRPNSGVMGSSEIAINANFATIYFGDTGILSTYRLSD